MFPNPGIQNHTEVVHEETSILLTRLFPMDFCSKHFTFIHQYNPIHKGGPLLIAAEGCPRVYFLSTCPRVYVLSTSQPVMLLMVSSISCDILKAIVWSVTIFIPNTISNEA